MSAYFDLSCDIQRHDRRNRRTLAELQEQNVLQAAQIESLQAQVEAQEQKIAALTVLAGLS